MKGPIQKLDNVHLLATHPALNRHLPATEWLTKPQLKQMLRQFSSIYLKPNNSCQGKGIMRILKLKGSGYLLKTRDSQKSYRLSNFAQMWKYIQHEKRNRPYIVQQGIESRTNKGRLFDIRVHLARIDGEWVVGGLIGRIATKNGIATNAYSGGVPTNIHKLLINHMHYSPEQKKETMEQLSHISLIATNVMSEHYPEWSEFGLDIGIDANEKMWVYEINIKPGLYVFRFEKELLKKLFYMRKIAR